MRPRASLRAGIRLAAAHSCGALHFSGTFFAKKQKKGGSFLDTPTRHKKCNAKVLARPTASI